MTTYRQTTDGGLARLFKGRTLSPGAAWGIMILGALLAFEVFNFTTTEFALIDVLGDLTFGGLRWATILAIAFCGIDFAGIARIFTPEQGADEPAAVWYLLGAWLLAAAMNAMLTWWGVSIAILNNSSLGAGSVVSSTTLTKAVPIFVAAMVLLIRVLIIGSFSLAGDRMFGGQKSSAYSTSRRPTPRRKPVSSQAPADLRSATSLPRPAPKPQGKTTRPEPTYQNMSFGSSKQNNSDHYES